MGRSAAQLEQWADYCVHRAPGKTAANAARLARSEDSADDRLAARALLVALAKAQRCRDCGRPLEDPVSIERGVGPDCADKRARAAS